MATPPAPHRPTPMNVHVRDKPAAGHAVHTPGGIHVPTQGGIVRGVSPTPDQNLIYHGGRLIPKLTFVNFYVSDNWPAVDRQNIDHALTAAMREPTLNNVMAQYFREPPGGTFHSSRILPGVAPPQITQDDLARLIISLDADKTFAGFDLTSTVFNFLLPPGVVLSNNPVGSDQGGAPPAPQPHRDGVPDFRVVDSTEGLGGYHGSVETSGKTIYYAVGVSSMMIDGQPNGVPGFKQSWKKHLCHAVS